MKTAKNWRKRTGVHLIARGFHIPQTLKPAVYAMNTRSRQSKKRKKKRGEKKRCRANCVKTTTKKKKEKDEKKKKVVSRCQLRRQGNHIQKKKGV